jgi:hypothetical protein
MKVYFNKIQTYFEAQNFINDWWRFSQKPSTPRKERQSLTELTVICTIASEWERPNRHPHGRVPVLRNRVTKV